jgi:hypothetical protein
MKKAPGTKLETNLIRTNVILDRKQYMELKRRSELYGGSLSFYIRKAVEQYLKGGDRNFG